MKSWRQRLVLRRGRRGGITSPVSTSGYTLQGFIGLVFLAAGVAIGMRGDFFALIPLVIARWPLRDALA